MMYLPLFNQDQWLASEALYLSIYLSKSAIISKPIIQFKSL